MFKQCSLCKYEWSSRAAFLDDPSLHIVGYQVNFNHLQAGLFLFNHSCGTTIALPAENFADMYDGPIFKERHDRDASCPQYCLSTSDLRPCPVQCECAFVREVVDMIAERERSLPISRSAQSR